MCCCEKDNVNGQPGFRWQPTHKPGVYPPAPPALAEGETLMFDEPGRCIRNKPGTSSGLDSHCHHYRLVQHYGTCYLLCRNGLGDSRYRLSMGHLLLPSLMALDSNTRYLLFNELYHAAYKAALAARNEERCRWQAAALDKRIKLRKHNGVTRVEILPEEIIHETQT